MSGVGVLALQGDFAAHAGLLRRLGVLTREVFGLEVTRSGFHRMLADRIIPGGTYGDVLASFGGELGAEARGLVRAMLAGQSRADDHGVSDR